MKEFMKEIDEVFKDSFEIDKKCINVDRNRNLSISTTTADQRVHEDLYFEILINIFNEFKERYKRGENDGVTTLFYFKYQKFIKAVQKDLITEINRESYNCAYKIMEILKYLGENQVDRLLSRALKDDTINIYKILGD